MSHYKTWDPLSASLIGIYSLFTKLFMLSNAFPYKKIKDGQKVHSAILL